MISELERRANAIPEVAKVENLLHLPNAPAPTRADTPKSAQASRRTKGTAPARKRTPKKVNAEPGSKPADTPPSSPGRTWGPDYRGLRRATADRYPTCRKSDTPSAVSSEVTNRVSRGAVTSPS